MFLTNAKNALLAAALFSMGILTAGCDLYQSKTTEIDGVDKIVCEQFSDSLFQAQTTQVAAHYNKDWKNATVAEFADSLIDSLLTDSLFLEQNYTMAYQLTLNEDNDTSYVAVRTSTTTLVIFCTDIVKLNLYAQTGELYSLESNEMPLGTISGCTYENEAGVKQPVIKMREKYSAASDSLLLQIIKVDQTKGSIFKISVQ